jgi:hypothetical protein
MQDLVEYCLEQNQTRPLLKKYISIGEWNMDLTAWVQISLQNVHGPKIKNIGGQIVRDDGVWYNIHNNNVGSAGMCFINHTDTIAQVERVAGGYCDDTNFDGTSSTVSTRGYIIIEYEA